MKPEGQGLFPGHAAQAAECSQEKSHKPRNLTQSRLCLSTVDFLSVFAAFICSPEATMVDFFFFSFSGLIVVTVRQSVQSNYSTVNKSQNIT